MKIHHGKCNQGSAFIVTMIFVLTLAAILVSYLFMIENTSQTVSRSQFWNNSLALAESGVEEALEQVNSGTSYSANGWTSAGGDYLLSRNLNGGTYAIGIVPGQTATIYSTGTVTVPITGALVSRVVKVTATQEGLFNVGLGAVDNINMNGNSVSVDSWNSYNTNQSANGLYNGYSGNNGSMASENGVVNIGNHTVQGNLYLGPNATYSSGAGQITGTIYSDYNVTFPPATLPTTDPVTGNSINWAAEPVAPVLTVGSGHNATTEIDITTSGEYVVGAADSSYPIVVQPGITATLDVQATSFSPASVTINGGTTNSGTIYMYQQSGTVSLAGNSGGGPGNRPENFYYFGLPGVTSITFSGNSSFVGAIYAPNASLTLNGGGNANNLEGAAIVNSVTLNGHYDFHYDTSLETNGPSRGFIPMSWQEL